MSPQTSLASSSGEVSNSRDFGATATGLLPSTSIAIDGSISPRGQSFSQSLGPSGLSPGEENTLLDTFQTHMISYFPFIVLGGANFATTRTERPFLLATIVLAASREKVTRQTPAARRLLQSFSERCLLDGQTNLDLLQAILVYIQWCNYHFINNPQISILIQLAVTLVAELGLDKKLRPRLSRQQQLLAEASTQSGEDPNPSQCHSAEEMRAFLGCFYLSSIISASFKRVEAMTYTPYVDACCTAIEQRNQFPTDVCLVELVKTQIIARKLSQSLPSDDLKPLWSSSTPIGMIVKLLEAEVEKLFTQDMQGNITFLLHYHHVRISLYEVGLRNLRNAPAQLNFPHLELRYSCLVSIMAYLDVYFLIPPDLYFALPSVIWIQLADIITILARLLLIGTAGWDLSHARSVGDLTPIFERLERNFEAASAAARKTTGLNGNGEDDKFRAYAIAMRRGRSAYETRLASQLEGANQVADPFGQSHNAVPDDFMSDEEFFWQEALVDWSELLDAGTTSTWS